MEYSEETKVISPKEMTLVFELSEKECHLKFTGKCSLDRFFPYRSTDNGNDSDYEHCRKIFKSLKKHGQRFDIEIIKYRCGHYAFNDGQHRVCIAKRKDLRLKAFITTVYNEDCDICRNYFGKNAELR